MAVRPVPSGAHFNDALILEALGLRKQAIDAWTKAAADEKGDWAREARDRRDALKKLAGEAAERRWELAKEKIEDALKRNDEAAIETTIAPFRFTAKRYFEDILLPKWANAPSATQLAHLKTFAAALTKISGDNYARDIVAAIDNAAQSPSKLAELKGGHTMLEHAHDLDGAMAVDAALPAYRTAASLLKRGGSALYLGAEIGEANAVLNKEGNVDRDVLPLFREIERAARSRGYTRLEVSARTNAANALSRRDRNIEALAEYGYALAFYQRAGDWEGLASTQARRTGILRLLGQYEDALRDALPYIRHAANIIDSNSHHLLIGETAAIATHLGCPRTALALLNAVVQHFEEELAATPPDKTGLVNTLKTHVAFARENRAAAEVHLGQYVQAQNDLTLAARFFPEDVSRRHALEAQLHQIRGTSLLNTDPNGAAAELAQAAALDDEDYTSFRVAVLAERAQALRRAGKRAEAEADIRAAVDQVTKEEAGTLAERNLQKEPIWNGYFDRHRDAYDLLIRQLVEDGRGDEAFAYNEQSHALEPFDLIVRSGFAAPEVKGLAAAAPQQLLASIRSQLPPDTFVIEYRVLNDVTYVWLVSRDSAQLLPPLPPTKSDVERWTNNLQTAAGAQNREAFASGLYAPYDRLIAPVLAKIHLTTNTRLVFIPDEFMHALPFPALRDPNSKQYLIEQATVSISGSAKLYLFSLLRDRALKQPNGTAALLVGNPAFDPRYARGTQRLAGAGDEVQQLRRLYGAFAKALTDTDATVPRFLQTARDSQIVHVAAHAFTDGEAPSQSYLLLAPSANDSGVLDAQKLLTTLHLDNTRLVVLGACRSGGSVTVGPQGVGPLVRPFLAAGVPGVIGTLWDINDATAKEVLVSFHGHYHQGSDAAAALRAAQIELLRKTNPGLSSELTWAAYQAIGYASSPFAATGEMKKEKPPP